MTDMHGAVVSLEDRLRGAGRPDERPQWVTLLLDDLRHAVGRTGISIDDLVSSVGPPEVLTTLAPVRQSLRRRDLIAKLHQVASVRHAVSVRGENGLSAKLAMLSATAQFRDAALLYAVAELLRPETVDGALTVRLAADRSRLLHPDEVLGLAFSRAAKVDPTECLDAGDPDVAEAVEALVARAQGWMQTAS